MDVAYGEEFDEAFLLELDAVEAVAVQHSHDQRGSTISSNLQPSCSTGRSKLAPCHQEASSIVGLYRWMVENISVKDDAGTEGLAQDNNNIGKV